MRKMFALLGLMIIYSPLVRAQSEPLPPPIVFVSTFLELSQGQTEGLISMIQTRDAAIRPIAEMVQTKKDALGKLVETGSPDPAAVGQLLLDIHNGEKQAYELAEKAARAFEETLTPEQLEKLQVVRQAKQVAPAIPPLQAVGLL